MRRKLMKTHVTWWRKITVETWRCHVWNLLKWSTRLRGESLMKFINWQETVKNPSWKQWLRNKDQMCGTLRGKKNSADFTLESLFVCVTLMVSKQYSARGEEPSSYHTALYSVMMPERERGKMTCFLLENAAVKHYREQDCVCVCAIVSLRAHFSRTKKRPSFQTSPFELCWERKKWKGFRLT